MTKIGEKKIFQEKLIYKNEMKDIVGGLAYRSTKTCMESTSASDDCPCGDTLTTVTTDVNGLIITSESSSCCNDCPVT